MKDVVFCLMVALVAWAPCVAEARPPQGPPVIIDGPSAPVAPAVMSRDAEGKTTVRAIRLTESLRLDGTLQEEIYRTVPPIVDFIQMLPDEGMPASEKTEAWVMFDRENMYIAARCWDSAYTGMSNELRRDMPQVRDNDHFAVSLDTFYDRRNGFAFSTNPVGGRGDFVTTDEGNPNVDWNPVWDVRASRFDGGWMLEMAIPFKSLRYKSGPSQVWGIQFRRLIRRKNEWIFLTHLPASGVDRFPGIAINRISMAATLVGLDLPSASKNVELKPYGISRLTTDRSATPATVNHLDADVGFDAKYGVTANLTVDFTYNTDFAQVEVDEQQINLTRFSLFFPEKREFFLEGRGFLDFGRPPGISGFGGGSPLTPSLFYSRRIGLNQNRVVPIDVGGRLTGKVGKFGLGLINIQTAEDAFSATPATNFTVMRVKQDILRRSSIGAIFTNRSASTVGSGSNQAYGLDAAFSFFQDVSLNGYVAQTKTPGLARDDTSYQVRFDYGADRYGVQLDHLTVGDHFNPEVGFLRRDDFKRSFASLRFSPRPHSIAAVRKFTWEGNLEYILNGAGLLESRQQQGRFNIDFESSDQFNIEVSRNYELLVRPFPITRDIAIPVGGYPFSDVQAYYLFGPQRRASGRLLLQRGHFYSGTITALGFGTSRISITSRFSLEPGLSLNRVELPQGTFTTTLLRSRADYAFSPWMYVSTLLQYSSSDRTFSSNLRFRWEYHPGSECFLVYTDERNTEFTGFPLLKNRAFVVKINRLFRF